MVLCGVCVTLNRISVIIIITTRFFLSSRPADFPSDHHPSFVGWCNHLQFPLLKTILLPRPAFLSPLQNPHPPKKSIQLNTDSNKEAATDLLTSGIGRMETITTTSRLGIRLGWPDTAWSLFFQETCDQRTDFFLKSAHVPLNDPFVLDMNLIILFWPAVAAKPSTDSGGKHGRWKVWQSVKKGQEELKF